MIISEINENIFEDFASKHTLKNFFQTKEYGINNIIIEMFLVVIIKEKPEQEVVSYKPLYALFSGVITGLNIKRGTIDIVFY